jgi:hypothetical protein
MDHRKTLIVDTLLKAVSRRTSSEQRLKHGLFLRNQFQGILKQGRVPMHPRFEWLRKQSRTMLELLLAMAQDYDKTNPATNDKASMADLLDICDMTRGHIAGICEAGVLDTDDVQLLPFEEVQPEVSIGPSNPDSTIAVIGNENNVLDDTDDSDETEEDEDEEES